jgi:putative membrane protein insertion efficiency factor
MRWLGIAAIRYYQRHLRHMHNRVCIYTPSCSEYTILCIRKHGLFRGIRYGQLRIRRCNGALFAGGDDWP